MRKPPANGGPQSGSSQKGELDIKLKDAEMEHGKESFAQRRKGAKEERKELEC
jgi:hypothetical protein